MCYQKDTSKVDAHRTPPRVEADANQNSGRQTKQPSDHILATTPTPKQSGLHGVPGCWR